MVKISPSMLAADFTRLLEHVKEVEKSGVEYLHIDVMDGHFVPNISFGAMVVKSLKGKVDLVKDVHLMIENPDDYIAEFVDAGADIITVHIEACPHIHRTIQNIKSHGIKAGVALNPGTSLSTIDEILPELDMVLIMSVNPGFGGQSFIESSVKKVSMLKRMCVEGGLENIEINIDGGINNKTIKSVVDAGADVVVAGSAIFGKDDPAEAVKELRKCAE